MSSLGEHKSSPRILDTALEMLTEIAPQRGVLIDIPCGTGHLAQRAAADGWTVIPCDLEPEAWNGSSEVEVKKVDLDQPFPLDDNCADAIACCEGLEHIENPWHVLREFHRVLRPGGTVVITIPNTIDLKQRLRMLRHGHVAHYISGNPRHINHMGPFVLAHALIREGFQIRAAGSPKRYGGLVFKALAPFVRFREKRAGLPKDVCEMLSSPDVLLGRTAVTVATLAS